MWGKGFARFSLQKGSLLTVQISVSCSRNNRQFVPAPHFPGAKHTGLRFFLSSASRVPAFRAMISGAASGSWAMGDPHSPQNTRWTSWPLDPLEEYFLVGPLTVSEALGTTATRAIQ